MHLYFIALKVHLLSQETALLVDFFDRLETIMNEKLHQVTCEMVQNLKHRLFLQYLQNTLQHMKICFLAER